MKTISFYLTILLICSLLEGMPAFAQEIIAHRGASYLAPENTVAAVQLGYELGADAVEVDIHLSADKRLMVNHDKDTKRTAGGHNLIIAETHSNELRKLEVGSWKDEKFRGEKMPFLEEVLVVVPEGKRLVIELKSSAESVPYLKELIEESDLQEQLVLISFDKEAIIQAKQQLPEIPAYWLLHNYKEYSQAEAIDIAREQELQGLDVHYSLVNEVFMQQMQTAGLNVYVYTVNDPAEAKRLQALGVKGLTTDRPRWLREQLDNLKQ
jgi:glycerophosphoryl diester phosphodiesterase